MQPKLFVIGFHKTGTTSLGVALSQLGYRVTGPNGVNDPNISENVYSLVNSLVDRFDAFRDNPWPILYQYLDQQHPGSKFILTVRDSSSWIESQVRHFGKRQTPMRKWIYGYGCPEGHELTYIERYERHNNDVLRYFGDRKDLLVMDLTRGDGWETLCAFLGHAIPSNPFPHVNKARSRY